MSLRTKNAARRIAIVLLLALPGRIEAREPGAKDREAAIRAGDFTPYFAALTKWLDRKVPADPAAITKQAMRTLLRDPDFLEALAERHFMAKVWGPQDGTVYAFAKGVRNLDAFVRADPKNRAFLAWVLGDARLMDDVMLTRTPSSLHGYGRIDDSHSISPRTLETWKRIYDAHPESREGLYLRLAVATVLRPPGTGNRGAGMAKEPADPLSRFAHYLEAHKRKELFPSFDRLSTWELTHVVSSCASDADLAWGREMVNTFMPQVKRGEHVVSMTSQVWQRASQIPYEDFSCVLAGGGKCGPRSSFGVFINQAFGIPSIGVGQPGHAAICWRGPDGSWQIGYGRGWNVSKVADRNTMSGGEFLEMVRERMTSKFAQIEHLRWIASLIESPASPYLIPADRRYQNARAAAVMALAETLPAATGRIEGFPPATKPDERSALEAFEAPSDDGEYYGARVRGFVHPPVTGDYVFGLSSDDHSDLFLSTDDDPDNRVFIAHIRGWTAPRDYFGRKSAPIRLERGRRYYIEALHEERDGGDHLAVAWDGPGVTAGVISGTHLSPYPSGPKGTILREVWRNRGAAAPAEPAAPPVAKPEPPLDVPPGVIHVEAEAFASQGGLGGFGHPGVPVIDCHRGGRQAFFQAMMQTAWAGYRIQVPETGIYELTARVAAVNWGQRLYVRSFGAMHPVREAKASDVFGGNVRDLGPRMATDGDLGTRWAMNHGKDQGWIELDLGRPRTVSRMIVDERSWNRVSKFRVDYKAGAGWKLLFEGGDLGLFQKAFPPVTTQHVRLTTLDTRAPTGGPTLWDISVGDVFDGNGWIDVPWSREVAGRWQTTKPLDIRLVRGDRTIWLCAPSQRGLALRWFRLKPKVSGK